MKNNLFLYRFGSNDTVEIDTTRQESFNGTPGESLAFYQKIVQLKAFVFDIGANMGDKTDLFLQLGANVVCVEPQPQFVSSMQQRFKDNPQVHIEPVGVSSKEGTERMFNCFEAPNISTFSVLYTRKSRFVEMGYRWKPHLAIKMVTLDSLIQKYDVPLFCKIDVENYEYEVLKGWTHRIIPWISFECNTDQLPTTKLCIEYLSNMGYTKFNYAPGERGLFLFPSWLSGTELLTELERVMAEYDFSSIHGLWGDIYATL